MNSNSAQGTLYGLGMGPGDPDLLTLKAVDILNRVQVVFAAGSTRNDYSLALDIAAPHMKAGTAVRHLGFPMTQDRDSLEKAWKDNARQVLEVLNQGLDAAFLTIGDPLTYSTYGYLMKTLKALDPKAAVVTVPGVTAYQTAAARVNMPLMEGSESLMVASGTCGAGRIEELAAVSDNMVILKAYRNYDDICRAVDEAGPDFDMTAVSRCGLGDENVSKNARDLMGENQHYLTLLLVKKKGTDSLGPA